MLPHFFTNESKKHFQQQFRIIKEEGESESEFEIVQKNGKILPLWFNAKATYDNFGKFTGALIHFIDITSWKLNGQMLPNFKKDINIFQKRFQKIIEEEKRLSDDVKKFAYSELEQIFNTAADGMSVIDKNFNLIQINNTFLKMLEISKHETVGKKCYEVFPSSLCHTHNCPLIRIFKSDDHIECGTEIEFKNRCTLPCILTAAPFLSPNGALIGIIENFRSLNNIKHGEDIIQKQKYIKEKVFDISIDGFYVSDAEGNIVDANPAFTNLIGYSREELLCMKIGDIEVVEDPKNKKDSWIIEGFTLFETRFRHKNGNIIQVEISSSLIYRRWERFFISSVHDITEHKQREKQMQFLSYAVEHSTDGIALLDLDGHLLSINNAFAAIHGYNPEELLGKHISIFYPYPLKDYLTINNYKIEAVKEFKGSVWHMRYNKTIFPARVYNTLLEDKEGSPIGYVMTIEDITKEKRLYKSITKNESADRLLLNTYADSAFLIDTDGEILSLNEKAAKDFDTHSDELVGMCLYDLLPTKQELAFKDLIGKVVHCNKPVYFAEGLVGKGKDENYYPILDEHGKVVKVAIFYRNITGGVKETFSVEEKEKIKNPPEEKDIKSDIEGKETSYDFLKVVHIHKKDKCSFCFENIISRSPKIWDIFEILPAVAESVSTVLIQGASGTGKRLFAKAIHNLSARRDKPFITVNCGAIPDTLLESELFGYKAGAFTDAKKDKPGRFALADGGSLFLDEIGDISLAMQVRLLRFLQEKVYEPLGSLESIKADVRIITATNKNLENLVKEGNFREDLFYRINVVKLDLPALRERMEDVPLLIEHFIDRYNEQYGKKINGISEEALMCLLSHDYPGNIRELENIIERTIILCSSGKIKPNHLPKKLTAYFNSNDIVKSDITQIQQMEAAFLINMLKQNNWNRQKTAVQLGIHKTTLFRKIKTLGLKIPKSIRESDS